MQENLTIGVIPDGALAEFRNLLTHYSESRFYLELGVPAFAGMTKISVFANSTEVASNDVAIYFHPESDYIVFLTDHQSSSRRPGS